MRARKLSFCSFNLYNLNEPGLRMYRRDGWTEEEYAAKIWWTRFMLQAVRADVYGFQELWHEDSLKRAFSSADFHDEFDLLIPPDQKGARIVNAAAVRKGMLIGDPEWITAFPDSFKLESSGDDPQQPDISVNLDAFSRPVLHFQIEPREDREPVDVYVCHFKSKRPTDIYNEGWYRADRDAYADHRRALGDGLSTIRRTAEATALRILLTEKMKKTTTPVVVLGDLNDGDHSNTLNILTEQPKYLGPLQKGGRDTALYSGQTLQKRRAERDVYYTHVYKDSRESLDHILVSEEFYDNSQERVWAFDEMVVYNDHLNREEHKDESGANDHGVICSSFAYKPARSASS